MKSPSYSNVERIELRKAAAQTARAIAAVEHEITDATKQAQPAAEKPRSSEKERGLDL
jgi:hypothetical protein